MWELLPQTLPGGRSLAQAAAVLAAALGCGLLIGIERERRKGQGRRRAFAGLRTFALTCVLGSAAMLSGATALVGVGALLIAALGVVAHARDRSADPGVTTEVALWLTYLIGVLAVWSIGLAAAMAVGLTALLAARQRLHDFALRWLQPGEVRDGIVLAALVLIALPLLPDRPLWADMLNPHRLGQLLALLLGIQSLAHLSQRLLQARQAVLWSSVAAGFISSTATIASMGWQVRQGQAGARWMAGAGLLSCVATLLQVLTVALAIAPAWLPLLWAPCLAGSVVALAGGWWLLRGAADGLPTLGASSPHAEGLGLPGAPTPALQAGRMFSLRGAFTVAALLACVQLVVQALSIALGAGGAMAGALLAALADLHSSVAAILAANAPLSAGVGMGVLTAAIALHGLSKLATAAVSGGWAYLGWLAPGLLLHTAVAVAGLALQR